MQADRPRHKTSGGALYLWWIQQKYQSPQKGFCLYSRGRESSLKLDLLWPTPGLLDTFVGGLQALSQVLYLSDFKPITSRNHRDKKSKVPSTQKFLILTCQVLRDYTCQHFLFSQGRRIGAVNRLSFIILSRHNSEVQCSFTTVGFIIIQQPASYLITKLMNKLEQTKKSEATETMQATN